MTEQTQTQDVQNTQNAQNTERDRKSQDEKNLYNTQEKQRKIALVSAAVLGGIVLLALLAYVWYMLHSGKDSGQIATITYHGQVVRTIDLSKVTKTETFTIGENGEVNVIQVSLEGIGVISANCPDQICVNEGIHDHGPEPIVCLPHRLSIRFSSNQPAEGSDSDQEIDAVVGRY